jgi:hypothetical protein
MKWTADELRLAARLTKYDFKAGFLSLLHDSDLFEHRSENKIKSLLERFPAFTAQPPRHIDIPKDSLLSRPGTLPIFEDWVVYTATAVRIARDVEPNLISPEEEILFSFRWNETDPVSMFRSRHLPYQAFRARSLHLADESPYILVADIASFFEHIGLDVLKAQLLTLGAAEADVDFLVTNLLQHWTHASGRGIPQGPWASSYIANVMLDSIDKAMIQYGYTYIRYVDDVRVFCGSTAEARQAVLHVIKLARDLGLSIQTAKTRIFSSGEFTKVFRGFEHRLEELKTESEFVDSLKDLTGMFPTGGYGSTLTEEEQEDEKKEELEESRDNAALNRLFEDLSAEPAYRVDRTGLRFVLNRLARMRSDIAVEYCLQHLADLPDLALEVGKYLSHFSSNVQARVLKFISSDECIYEWQRMHLLSAMQDTEMALPALTKFAFDMATDRNRHVGVRSVGVDFLEKNGTYQQINELRRRFPDEPSVEVRAAIILASRKLHRTERAMFLKACMGISASIDSAVQLVLNEK